jgi:hypothetical protein
MTHATRSDTRQTAAKRVVWPSHAAAREQPDRALAMSVPARQRLLVVVPLGILAGHMAMASAYRRNPAPPDILQFWYSARTLLSGGNGYDGIGPGLAFDYPFPMVYPLTASVAAIPLTPFSAEHASALFMSVAVACFAWALLDSGWSALITFASFCIWHAISAVQWSPLLAASLILPPIAVLLAVKPTLGAALWIARPSRWAVWGGALLAVAAFALDPLWISQWREAVGRAMAQAHGTFPYHAPVMMPGGVLVLAALTRWRRVDARLLVALACIPHTTLPYELVPLFLIPRGWRQYATLAALSNVMWLVASRDAGFYATVLSYTKAAVPCMYLPCTLMILRRPNEGTVPAWLERRIAGWSAPEAVGSDAVR